MKPIKIDDYRLLAKSRLPRTIFDYLEGGAGDERTIRRNCGVFEKYNFVPRRLVNVHSRSIKTSLLGRDISAPMIIGATGLNGLFWPNGDLALANAARRHQIPFVVSTVSSNTLEEIASSSGGELWFQLYVVKQQLSENLIQRALNNGYKTLVVTVDVPINGYRERDIRNQLAKLNWYSPRAILDGVTHPRWLWRQLGYKWPSFANLTSMETHSVEVRQALLTRTMDSTFDWESLVRIRELWPHRLIVKGILHPADALRCESIGADAILLSNHGGRQLDDCVSPLDVLADIASASGIPVLVDGGFRRGSDLLKAISLGAGAVCLGRAALYGLAASGENGVYDILNLLKNELDQSLAHVGCSSIADVNPDLLLKV